jgi:lipopolysaccharide/colanic/teichoic acid biosynthesis glycosyltransferase
MDMRPSMVGYVAGSGEKAKRVCDVVLAVTLALITWPLGLIAALAVWLNSAGPIIYCQDRVGLNGVSNQVKLPP